MGQTIGVPGAAAAGERDPEDLKTDDPLLVRSWFKKDDGGAPRRYSSHLFASLPSLADRRLRKRSVQSRALRDAQ